MKRLVRVEIESTESFCALKCPWWDRGFAGRGVVCSLFERVLEQQGKDFVRTEKCKEAEVKS